MKPRPAEAQDTQTAATAPPDRLLQLVVLSLGLLFATGAWV